MMASLVPALLTCPICGQPAQMHCGIQDHYIECAEDCSAPRLHHYNPRYTATSWNDWAKWYQERQMSLHELYDGIVAVQNYLIEHHCDAEIGCENYTAIKALSATYELQNLLSEWIAEMGDATPL